MYGAEVSGFYSSGVLVSCCPGPGSSWGNLTVPPPSKEGESPSNKVLLVLLVGWLVGAFSGGVPSFYTSRSEGQKVCVILQ